MRTTNLISIGILTLASIPWAAHAAEPAVPRTMRVDYMHSGNALNEHFALERVLIEPLPWPGNPAQPLDTTNRGVNAFEVVDPKTNRVLYSRGFSTVFGEWQTTEEAQETARGFGESLRFPAPDKPVRVRVLKRDERNAFSVVWTFDIDPASTDIVRSMPTVPVSPIAIRNNGPSRDKVDLLILGDGYTAAEAAKFAADARRLSDTLFRVAPFSTRAADFNVWALMAPTDKSGISRPSTGQHHASVLGTRYDIFGSERYVLTLDNRAFRDLAQNAPYEFVEILVNNETYGGGGIFGQFSTAAAGSEWADYLFVHEFGHHFAALADEYYTSPVAYQSGAERPEPWEPNVTALQDPSMLKWKDAVKSGTALPTPWPKEKFEAYQREYQKKRNALRAANRPEAEMNALFRQEREFTQQLLNASPTARVVGAFEGANYQASGYYRSEMQCVMFSRIDRYCGVCQRAIEDVIDLYSRPAAR
jgi:IgA Peptidase M64/Peptidase M64 N-terminus